WILNRDWPSVTFGWRAERVDGAPSGTDKSRRDVPPLQQFDDAIDGVAFGDATQIELHAGRVEGNRPRRRIQYHVGAADETPRGGELVLRGHAALSAEEAPRFHQRADRDVKRSAGVVALSHLL